MPGPLFVSTYLQARHGVFAIEKTPQAVFQVQGVGAACILGQFAWGPAQTLTEPASPKDLTNTVAPPGIDRTNSAYLGVIRKGFPDLWFVRVMGANPVKAFADFPNAVPTVICRVTVKHPGTAGNSFTGTISAADDGDSNHFNLTVTITGTSGTTTETIPNINFSGTGADSTFDFSTSLLLGSITKTNAGRPVAGTVSFASGTTPAVLAADYAGTANTGDKGMALMEGSGALKSVFLDDTGNSLRAGANAALQAHALLLGDRVAYINGNSGQTAAAAQTDVANYRSDRVMYIDAWVYILDELGNKTLVPSASFAASVASRVSPSTSIAWKDPEVQAMLSGINSLEADRGNAAGTNTSAGICTLIREEKGGFTFEADVNALFPVSAARGYNTRRRMTDLVAQTCVENTRSFGDAPNLLTNQQNILNGVSGFMDTFKDNAGLNRDPNHTPHVLDWGFGDLTAENSAASIAAGNFVVPIDVQDSSGIYRLFFDINSGTGVTVRHGNQ